jgi:hypothetical protein
MEDIEKTKKLLEEHLFRIRFLSIYDNPVIHVGKTGMVYLNDKGMWCYGHV